MNVIDLTRRRIRSIDMSEDKTLLTSSHRRSRDITGGVPSLAPAESPEAKSNENKPPSLLYTPWKLQQRLIYSHEEEV